MDILDLNPEVLEATATIIEGYCGRQKMLMEAYVKNTEGLSFEWTDDQTMGLLLDEIKHLRDNVEETMDEILAFYPGYFRDKAEQIRRRPKF